MKMNKICFMCPYVMYEQSHWTSWALDKIIYIFEKKCDVGQIWPEHNRMVKEWNKLNLT